MSRKAEDINIESWGDPEDEKVVIYINRSAYDAIYRHGAAYPEREVGGILVGNVSSYISGRYRIKIVGVIEAEAAPGSHAEMQFTSEAWQQLVASAQRNYPKHKVVGWYHTHPGFGAFLSDDDVNSHRLAFSHPWHIAAVCDPIKNELCFFGWDDSEIKPIKGFYTYGVPIERPAALSPHKTATVPRQRMVLLLVPVIVLFLALCGVIAFTLLQLLPSRSITDYELPLQAKTASFMNQNPKELYLYFFQQDGKVQRFTIQWNAFYRPILTQPNPEENLPYSGPIKEIQQPTITSDSRGDGVIGALTIKVITAIGNPVNCTANINNDGTLEWQPISPSNEVLPE
jgi:proteasome lid subunit RPN8/RPN11